jgi:hypothetical protein
VSKSKANRKATATRKQSWAEALKAEGVVLTRDDEHCSVPTDVHPADQNFAGGAAGFTVGAYPVSTRPEHKSKCVRRWPATIGGHPVSGSMTVRTRQA